MKKNPNYLDVLPTAIALVVVWTIIGVVLYWLTYAPAAFSGVVQNATIDDVLAPGQPLLEGSGCCGSVGRFASGCALLSGGCR